MLDKQLRQQLFLFQNEKHIHFLHLPGEKVDFRKDAAEFRL